MKSTTLTAPHIPLKNHINFKKIKLNSFKSSWRTKRLILNIIWGIMNLFILILLTSIILKSDSAPIYLIGIFIYASVYWIISAWLFDFLIGDEVDEVLKQP